MILPTQPSAPRLPMLGRTQARVIWFAMAAALVLAVVGAVVGASAIPAGPAGALPGIFLGVASLVVVVDLVVGYFVAARVRRSAPPEAPPDAIAATQVIVGSATALSGAFVCAVFFFLSREALLLVLVLPCAAALLSWFPSESRWAALSPARAPGAPPRRSMMRE